MHPDRLRFFWPTLCAVLAIALAGSTVFWRHRLRHPTERKSKPPATAFDKREQAYLQALAATLGYQANGLLDGHDAARLAAYATIEANRLRALTADTEPATLATRDPAFMPPVPMRLAPTMRLVLETRFTRYRYELINKSDRALAAPILFQRERWDSAGDLVAAAGFATIPDEVERAVAIWRFVCPRRVFGNPPTEGDEEHDVLKFLALYGYGFCDDSARAVATLARLSGLRSRVWALDGHVVAEIFAGGHWRMLDADQQAYFHRAGAPKDILGVEELAADRAAFANIVSFRGLNVYPAKYIDCFATRENNEIVRDGTSEHVIRPVLRAGERMAFTNFNWGRYFLGKYPTPPPRFFNGCFEYQLRSDDLATAGGEISIAPLDRGCRLSNLGAEAQSVELPFTYPFPIVGGAVRGSAVLKSGKAALRIEDREHARSVEPELRENLDISLDHFISVLTPSPTYSYALIFRLEPGAVLELRDFKVISDFQFSQLPLLKLEVGSNEIHAVYPEDSGPAAFDFVLLIN